MKRSDELNKEKIKTIELWAKIVGIHKIRKNITLFKNV